MLPNFIYGKIRAIKALAVASALLLCLTALQASAQQTQPAETQNAALSNAQAETTPALMPVFQQYKSVKIGMTEDEVRDLLGKPKVSDETGYFYIFSDEESAQISFDADKKVKMIAVFYSGKHENPPDYGDVFGQGAAPVTKDDGSIYNLVTYPQAGYWVAYSRLAGDNATVTVTMQKIQ
jgi:outer membrane protein assembly factor BamE (lipoprotein component of BamABCDE complex)